MILTPINQTSLFSLDNYLLDFIKLYKKKKLPTKILLSGDKGLGKSTLAFHLVNYILSINEEHPYIVEESRINPENRFYKLTINGSNPNLSLVETLSDKKNIDINQIRELIMNLNKSSFNEKERFVMIDNIETLNISSINALLKILEEPPTNTYFILINNDRFILPTLKSRCINFKVFLDHKTSISVINKILDDDILKYINKDLINYYATPGQLYYLIQFFKTQKHDLNDHDVKSFLKLVIKDNLYKKNSLIKDMIFEYFEFYFREKVKLAKSNTFEYYDYFLKRINDTKKFNLDEESLFMEFEYKILNG
ncbi:DNA polymerase III [Candidatus Pelagibacter sp. RS39]|uniref:DNA polymerase III n=1 Tax=Candidatus Pelagibacter sp. RS39 TaxID=1977864 RepID=UPI000A16AAFB|nr:DNA polymerase III [Candidatus Pelagibacter sp. RS39]ARJ47869.1 DNA polymerase III [Candidatus Pelagibacter sp. RS39]